MVIGNQINTNRAALEDQRGIKGTGQARQNQSLLVTFPWFRAILACAGVRAHFPESLP